MFREDHTETLLLPLLLGLGNTEKVFEENPGGSWKDPERDLEGPRLISRRILKRFSEVQ